MQKQRQHDYRPVYMVEQLVDRIFDEARHGDFFSILCGNYGWRILQMIVNTLGEEHKATLKMREAIAWALYRGDQSGHSLDAAAAGDFGGSISEKLRVCCFVAVISARMHDGCKGAEWLTRARSMDWSLLDTKQWESTCQDLHKAQVAVQRAILQQTQKLFWHVVVVFVVVWEIGHILMA